MKPILTLIANAPSATYFKLGAWLIAASAILLTGCQSYNERFTYHDPKTGMTNHVVHVSYRSLFMIGESAKLRTETQTMEFIRTVNADGIRTKVDAEGIGAAGTAAGNVIGAAGKAAAGIP